MPHFLECVPYTLLHIHCFLERHWLALPGESKNISYGVKDSKQGDSFGQEEQSWAHEGKYKPSDKADGKTLHSGTPAETVVVNHLKEENETGDKSENLWDVLSMDEAQNGKRLTKSEVKSKQASFNLWTYMINVK